jgi:hypothetical protein
MLTDEELFTSFAIELYVWNFKLFHAKNIMNNLLADPPERLDGDLPGIMDLKRKPNRAPY